MARGPMNRDQLVVIGSALLSRLMPVAIGFLVATFFGAKNYAETVLLITAANLCGSLPMLAVTPLVLRSADEDVAIALATRGLLAGAPIILTTTLVVSRYLAIPGCGVFLSTYTCAVFVLGISQALLNQQVRNAAAMCHAGIVSVASLAIALSSLLVSGNALVFLGTLGTAMLVAAIASITLAARHVRLERTSRAFQIDAVDVWNALWSGLFSIFLIAGIFLSTVRGRNLGNTAGFVAFSLGLQVFSVVIFIPGALSSYYVPQWVRSGKALAPAVLTGVLRTYLALGVIASLLSLAVAPYLFGYLQLPMTAPALLTYGLVQAAAVLAVLNSAYNQLLVSMGRFPLMAGLSLLWLLVLLGSQAVLDAESLSLSLSIFIAYGVLLLASRHVCRETAASVRAGADG